MFKGLIKLSGLVFNDQEIGRTLLKQYEKENPSIKRGEFGYLASGAALGGLGGFGLTSLLKPGFGGIGAMIGAPIGLLAGGALSVPRRRKLLGRGGIKEHRLFGGHNILEFDKEFTDKNILGKSDKEMGDIFENHMRRRPTSLGAMHYDKYMDMLNGLIEEEIKGNPRLQKRFRRK